MIGDQTDIKKEYLILANEVWDQIEKKIDTKAAQLVIAIGGESGSGKTILASALKITGEERNKNAAVLHQDDYFKLPPETNHNARLQDINAVGKDEVHLDLMQEHTASFKNGVSSIIKPLVDYKKNSFIEESINFEEVEILILEGTYVLGLHQINCKIFIDRNFLQTKKNRMARNRDHQDEFVEKVLSIEHEIIKKYKGEADIIVDDQYKIYHP